MGFGMSAKRPDPGIECTQQMHCIALQIRDRVHTANALRCIALGCNAIVRHAVVEVSRFAWYR